MPGLGATSPSFASSTFITYAVPDFHPDDRFILACTIPEDGTHNCRDFLKFHLAEFAIFKHLIEAVKPTTSPCFLTSCWPTGLQYLNYAAKDVLPAFSQDQPVVFNPYAYRRGHKRSQRRVCPGPIFDTLEQQITQAAGSIRHRGEPSVRMVILICGPTSLQQDLLTNLELPIPVRLEHRPRFLEVDELRRFIGKGVQSVLVTPNMLGAGWVVNPYFTTVEESRPSAELTQAQVRRATCNISPLIAKNARSDLLKEAVKSKWPKVGNLSQLSNRVRYELKALRIILEKGAFRFFFEVGPNSNGLNFYRYDNWSHFVGEDRRTKLEDYFYHWARLGGAVLGHQGAGNHEETDVHPATREIPGGYYDRTLLPNHCKVLAFVQRTDWLLEPSEEKRAQLFRVGDLQGLQEENRKHATKRLVLTSVYRLACHNLADLMVQMNSTNSTYESYGAMSSLKHKSAGTGSLGLGGGVGNLSMSTTTQQPLSRQERLDYYKSIFFDQTQSEFIDNPAQLGDNLPNSQTNFLRSTERPDRPLYYLAEVLRMPNASEELADSGIDVREVFAGSCKEAVLRDLDVEAAWWSVDLAMRREFGEPERQLDEPSLFVADE